MYEKERKRLKRLKNKRISITFKILFNVVGSIPDFKDIPKTQDTFWKETTYNKLIYGSVGGAKVKVYKDQGSAFIRCHFIESNNEYIHILKNDGTIADGIYRVRYADGNTGIGSKYFRRSGREEGMMYHLYRDNVSGNIDYDDKICGKDYRWRYLAKYRFNQETLEWTKI